MAARIKGRPYDPQPATLDQLRERMDEFPLAYSGPLFGIQRFETDPDTGNITGNSPVFDDFMSAWKETYLDKTPPPEDANVMELPLDNLSTVSGAPWTSSQSIRRFTLAGWFMSRQSNMLWCSTRLSLSLLSMRWLLWC